MSRDDPPEEVEQQIINLLGKSGPRTAEQVASLLDISIYKSGGVLSKLEVYDVVEKEDNRRYRLTTDTEDGLTQQW